MAIYSLKRSYQLKDLQEVDFKDLWGDHGIFTTMWIFGKPAKILFFENHIKNLIRSLQIYGIKKRYLDKDILKIINENSPVITVNNIKFANYGYNKNLITGRVFNKNFEIDLEENYKKLNFELLSSGIKAYIDLNENQKENLKVGTFKTKILNSNFKTNFEYDGKVIKIFNAYFRSKNLSLKNKSEIIKWEITKL